MTTISFHRAKHRKSVPWRKQIALDLDDVNPHLFGVVIVVISSAFVGSLAFAMLWAFGWVLAGLTTALIGFAAIIGIAVFWVTGKRASQNPASPDVSWPTGRVPMLMAPMSETMLERAT